MLKRLLVEIAAGRVGSLAELARAIDASPEMVGVMMTELERRGLLQRAGDCGSPCAGCPKEIACAPGASQGGAWMLTSAGRRSAEH